MYIHKSTYFNKGRNFSEKHLYKLKNFQIYENRLFKKGLVFKARNQ